MLLGKDKSHFIMQRAYLLIASCILIVAVVTGSILAFTFFSPKQAGNDENHVVWQQFLPGITGKKIIQTSDGGYLALGATADISNSDPREPTFVNEQPIIVKTDSLGNVQWQKTFQVLGLTPTLTNIAQTRDGGYAVVGGVTDSSAAYDNPFSRFCLIKLDSKGNVNWTQTYAGPSDADNVAFNTILETSGGGYTLYGTWSRYWDYHGLRSGYLVKTDEAGNAYFSKGVDTGPASSLVQTSDGYIFFTTQNAIGGGSKFLLVKTDFNGTTLWSNGYKEGYATSAYESAGTITNDGGYLLCGSLVSPDKGWLVKTDAEGRMVWNKTYLDVTGISSVAQAGDGGYVISGMANATEITYDKGTAYTAWFAKIDSMGNIEAEFRAGPVELKHSTAPSSIIQASDGGFICVGTWDQTYQATSSQRLWIAKISL
jgi:hypothetical protein